MKLTMNTNEVLALIDSIATTSGKNDKIAMLKAAESSDTLKKVLQATYDPTITYGIRAVPNRTALHDTGELFNEQTWNILSQMRNRTLTGSAMLAAVAYELDRLSVASAELLKRIMLKDMRAGFSEETCNKVWPGLVPDFPYQRCSLPKDAKFEEWDWEGGVISQEKADGMFTNVNYEHGGNVFIFSRAGSMLPMDKFESLAAAVQSSFPSGTQSHGELIVYRGSELLPREIGNGILTSVLKGGDFGEGEYPVFLVWDQINLESVKPKGKYITPYKMRLANLIDQLRGNTNKSIKVIDTRIVKSLEDAYKHYGELLAKGKEGTILKKKTAIWKDGTSKEQIKLKLEFESDLEIVAIVPGKDNGKNEGRAGSLTCKTACGGLVVDVSIKGEKMRDQVDANPDDWVGRIMPVVANMIMRPSESNHLHSLFLPRFSQPIYRTDKTVADNLSRAYENEAAAKTGAAILKKAA
ncbi:hypothetical protein RGU72_05145 [Undibacterium sp. 5I1]|uniref:ATP-dependent DNA ligase n=1 Tax=unclassified Undibacterium TaxID=2630295 RepID=UPI002AB55D05|nr:MULTISPECIES: hypothetical protein [unclassified Undibacterium]MDY7537640.1 hypothetical protein [Undibacterium sp. 5I1]MEB0230185.1 hypothetical protein [Undibacterium sp. 10I3]MEB0256377.1 hypothetical protein [Undibacterium sp. 5I1]